MKKLILLILIIQISCKSYEPFNSRKEKRQCINDIDKNLLLSKKYRQKIITLDSITNEICLSLKANIKQDLIKKRIDSFYNGNYNKLELYYILKLKRFSPDWDIEFDRSKNKKHLTFKDMQQFKKYIESFKIDTIK